MRKALVLSTAAAALVGTALATPAGASTSDTQLTVTLTGGSLSISAPATASLSGSVAPGTVITGPMGGSATTVTDETGSLLGWQVTAVTGGNLVSVSAPTHSIALAPLTGPLSLTPGVISASGSSLLTGVAAGVGGSLSTTAVSVATAAAGAGGGTYTYTPTLSLVVPPNTYAHADYKVTITQSVA